MRWGCWIWGLIGLLGAPEAAFACRCEQRPLADYFSTADEVFIGRLERARVDPNKDRQIFTFEPLAPAYKPASPQNTVPELPYASSLSTASCAVPAEIGAVYVVFAEHDPQEGVAWLTTCNGTRIQLGAGEDLQGDWVPQGFVDVPARFVPSQLNALAGLEVLREIAAREPDPADEENETLVGLLDLPPFSHGGLVFLRTRPEPEAELVASPDSMEALVHRESGYEVDAAVVYAVADGWYKLRLAEATTRGEEGGAASCGEFVWLSPDGAGTYWPLDELPIRRLAYLNQHWSGFVWPEAGAGLPVRSARYDPMAERAEIPVQVLESIRLAGSLWFRVEVLDSNGCEGGDPRVLLTGWIPAYGTSGEPVVWFYSRGC
jgi:hypothetical protein